MQRSPALPPRIGRLGELASNLWWSWHPQARSVFRALDYPLWKQTVHNPMRLLQETHPRSLEAAANDPAFLALYDAAMASFDGQMADGDSWFQGRYGNRLSGPVAFFCMEFAFHASLPIYAGGLGVHAGDICKEASDLGVPFVGVGFMYPQGYFHQHVGADGWQRELYEQLDFAHTPMSMVHGPHGSRAVARVALADRTVAVGAWLLGLGRTRVYLLDTDLEENAPQDRLISSRLYVADRERRIQQEVVLGIGGVRVLRALGIGPAIWHANEGHTAFMMLERIREEVEKGAAFNDALLRVASATVFTTHTPVPAGHDVFTAEMVEKNLGGYWESLGLTRNAFLSLGRGRPPGRRDGPAEGPFNMTALALATSSHRNGVSRLHGAVSRRMWKVLWPRGAEERVPIGHITNGVHMPTWVAPEMAQLFAGYVHPQWYRHQDERRLWDRVMEIPDRRLWEVHRGLKRKLFSTIQLRARRAWVDGRVAPQQVPATGALLDPDVLTIGYARRFAEYKRPTLLIQDVDRLRRLLTDPWRPVQVVFAGKPHPADFTARFLLSKVYSMALDPAFQGRVAFVEDYDLHLAHYLLQGVDLWLNNPRRPQEACGTSGMKAAANGIPQLSVLDGWWDEAYSDANGWAIGGRAEWGGSDAGDAEELYRLLEQEVVPLYYDQDRFGVPHGWTRVVKETIRSVLPAFSSTRMVKQYVERMYLAADPSDTADYG